jgi:hypothetical protein
MRLLMRQTSFAILLFGTCSFAVAQHISLKVGGGVGFFLQGGPGISDANGHKFLAAAVDFAGERFALRYIQGSLERTQGIPSDTADNDLDYFGFDFVVARRVTNLPADLAVGIVRFEEAYHDGYPDRDFGGRVFVHRWGPHVSVLRAWPLWRFLQVWGEADLHYAPYQPKQYVVLVNAGLGVRF